MKRKKEFRKQLIFFVCGCLILSISCTYSLVKKQSDQENLELKLQIENKVEIIVEDDDEDKTKDKTKGVNKHIVDIVRGLQVDANYKIVCVPNNWGATIEQLEKIEPYAEVEQLLPCYFLSLDYDFFTIRKNGDVATVFFWMLEKIDVSHVVFVNEDKHFIRFDNSYVCSDKLVENENGICTVNSYYLE